MDIMSPTCLPGSSSRFSVLNQHHATSEHVLEITETIFSFSYLIQKFYSILCIWSQSYSLQQKPVEKSEKETQMKLSLHDNMA